MTVREWFRKDRAAMWRDEAHPAHGCAGEIDRLATIISDVTNVPDGWRQVAHPVGALFLPASAIREGGQLAAADALNDLLYVAWTVADREKYDRTYSTLMRYVGDRPRASVLWHGITD